MTEPGLVIVDKPGGMTSHDVVGRCRRLFGTRKVGHAGTLDPMATGVLVIGIERATKILGLITGTDKSYAATIRLGQTTSTEDAEGDVLQTVPAGHVTDEQIAAAVSALRGAIDQVPSAVSAIKVAGERSYKLAREGRAVELPARPVRIERFDVLTVRRYDAQAAGPGHSGFVDVDVVVDCSSGTYIRALARDVGDALGVGGHLTALRRTAVGPYDLARAHTLDELAEDFALLPIAAAARTGFDSVDLTEAQATDVRFGRALDLDLPALTALFDPGGELLALYEPRDGRARAVAVFV